MQNKSHTNALIHESSPYLLQHAHNPVNWQPWGDQAFAQAASQNKPIFLSIGYSTCHWCHVMEHESFADPETASLMNRHFINIKVDREERPDIDDVYMTVCQMMTGSGGWPLSIIMTPDKKPFFAATYIPRTAQYGRIGMLELIPRVAELWSSQNQDILQSADKIQEQLQLQTQPSVARGAPAPDVLSRAVNDFSSRYDAVHGGFGNAPKFPSPHNLIYLLRYGKFNNHQDAIDMVQHTLKKMSLGGIYDHIGFGLHRYSTDAHWLAPHFEKMLYDQAMMITACTEAWQVTQNTQFKSTAQDICTYVMRDMTAPEGGYYSAEDADSEGVEGKFYLWQTTELQTLLQEKDYELVRRVYNVQPDGNFTEPTRPQSIENILNLSGTIAETAVRLDMDPSELDQQLEHIREILFHEREKRVHPFKDDKILTDWNGLMISAMAQAGRILDRPEYITSAEKAAQFILHQLYIPGQELLHRYRQQAGIHGFLDDYAFTVNGLLELYTATFNISYLEKAIEINDLCTLLFWDESNGGFYQTSSQNEPLPVRSKNLYDGAIPSGNAIAYQNLQRFYALTLDQKYAAQIKAMESCYAEQVNQMPSAHSAFLSGYLQAQQGSMEIIITGEQDAPEVHNMLRVIKKYYLPGLLLLFVPVSGEPAPLYDLAPWIQDYPATDNATTVYVCVNRQCELPVTTPTDLDNMLQKISL